MLNEVNLSEKKENNFDSLVFSVVLVISLTSSIFKLIEFQKTFCIIPLVIIVNALFALPTNRQNFYINLNTAHSYYFRKRIKVSITKMITNN